MTAMFPTAKGLSRGYHRKQVEEFFDLAKQAYEGNGGPADFGAAEVRSKAFTVVRRGYDYEAVDAAMDRLEAAFVQRHRADHVAINGEQAWLNYIAEQATTLYPRLLRPAGNRFAHPSGRSRGYDCAAVDALMEHLIAYFDDNKPLLSSQLRSVVFPPARGSKAYLEGPVDAYLARAIEVLLAVE